MNHFKSDWFNSSATCQIGLPAPLLEYGKHQDELRRKSKLPRRKKSSSLGNVDRIKRASQITARAAGMGIALSAIDGPLPIMDTIGFGIFAGASVLAWTNVIIEWE